MLVGERGCLRRRFASFCNGVLAAFSATSSIRRSNAFSLLRGHVIAPTGSKGGEDPRPSELQGSNFVPPCVIAPDSWG